MDYSTLKNIKSQRDLIADGIDLSGNYVNENEHEKIYSKYLNNNKINNNCGSDIDEDNTHSNGTTVLVTSSKHSSETKLKLNFSVDRILGNEKTTDDCNNIGDISVISNGVHHNYGYCNKYNGTTNCIDCSSNTISGASTSTSVPSIQPIFSVPYSMATMLNLNKAIVRPMPVRYLTRSPTGKFFFL